MRILKENIYQSENIKRKYKKIFKILKIFFFFFKYIFIINYHVN